MFHPGLYGVTQLAEAAFEKMVGTFDDDELARLGERLHESLEFGGGTELVSGPADEQLGLGAAFEEAKIVGAVIHGRDGQPKPDERMNAGISAGWLQASGSAKGKSGEDERQTKLLVEPVDRDADVVSFAATVIMFALTQPGAAKIEAQHGKSETVQGFHGVEDDFIVQRASEERMGMADERGMGGVLRPDVEQGFQTSGGTGKEKRLNSGVSQHLTQITTYAQNAASEDFIDRLKGDKPVPCGLAGVDSQPLHCGH